jgi:hypothetical protein
VTKTPALSLFFAGKVVGQEEIGAEGQGEPLFSHFLHEYITPDKGKKDALDEPYKTSIFVNKR